MREDWALRAASSTLTAGFVSALTLAGFGFAAFVSVFVRVAAGLLARVSVLTGVLSALTVTLVGLLALRVVAAGRARFSVLGVFFWQFSKTWPWLWAERRVSEQT